MFEALLLAYMAMAAQAIDLPVPSALPEFEMMAGEDLWHEYHEGAHPYREGFGPLAFYNIEDRRMIVNETVDFTTPHGASVLLHEMVHHVDVYHGVDMDCTERRAYAVQREFLAAHGRSLFTEQDEDGIMNGLLFMMVNTCKSERF